MKQITASLLLFAMLASLCACSDTAGGEDTTAPVGDTTAPAEETSPFDALPKENFDGETFTVLARTAYGYEFKADEENGDLLNDAIYRRNLAVEERFGIEIETLLENCAYGAQANEFNSKLKSSIMAGDGAYDLIAGYCATLPGIVSDGIFMNWNEIEHVDQNAAWWSANVAKELTINGKSFMITGDLSIGLWQNMNCFYYNHRLAEEYKLPDLYALVREGKWTLDKLIELSANAYVDLDGNTEKSDKDQYGFALEGYTHTDMLKEAFELPVTVKGDDGFPEFAVKSERMVDALTKMNAFIHETDSVYWNRGVTGDKNLTYACFSEGRSIFVTGILSDTDIFRAMEDDFGILPYPKYNEQQKNYHSTSRDNLSVFAVPVDAKNPGMTGLITEAMCIASYEEVVPVYYEVVLKDKMSRDENSKEMIDLIRDSLVFNFGYLHSTAMGSVGHLFLNRIINNSNTIVSEFDAKASTYNEKLKTVLEIYR